jgi:hypothetical protein
MLSNSIRAVTMASAIVACTLPLASTANAGPYDGSWSVTVITRSGPCDPSYRYGVSISNGIVSGGGGASVSGRVTNSGAVSVVVSSSVGSARGSGHLSRNGGGGSWSGQGQQGRCSGTWSASRG